MPDPIYYNLQMGIYRPQSSEYPPGGSRAGFGPALGAALPDAVGHVVPDGGQDPRQLSRPVVQVQRAHAGQVGPQVPVDPRALDADQRPQVQTGPGGICRAVTGSGDVNDVNATEVDVSREREKRLTGSVAVHTQVVPLGVPDGLQRHGLALAAAPSLHTHTHPHRHLKAA